MAARAFRAAVVPAYASAITAMTTRGSTCTPAIHDEVAANPFQLPPYAQSSAQHQSVAGSINGSHSSATAQCCARLVQPVVLDMRMSDEELKRSLVSLRVGLSPVLAVCNHGCEQTLSKLATAAHAHHLASEAFSEAGTEQPSQAAIDLTGILQESADTARDELKAVADRILRVVMGDDSHTKFQADGYGINGRMCLRHYPAHRGTVGGYTERIGAHIDFTLLTLLWATGPGLEILSTESTAGNWTAEQVLRLGMPTTAEGDLRSVEESDWARVDIPWSEGVLLLSVGMEWLNCAPLMEALPVECAVLHRVAVPSGEERLSLPFLVNVESKA